MPSALKTVRTPPLAPPGAVRSLSLSDIGCSFFFKESPSVVISVALTGKERES